MFSTGKKPWAAQWVRRTRTWPGSRRPARATSTPGAPSTGSGRRGGTSCSGWRRRWDMQDSMSVQVHYALNHFISEWEPWKAYVRAGGEHLRHVHGHHQDLHPGLLRGVLREYYIVSDIDRSDDEIPYYRTGRMMWEVPWPSTPAMTMMTTSPPSTRAPVTASLQSRPRPRRLTRPRWTVAEAASLLGLAPCCNTTHNSMLVSTVTFFLCPNSLSVLMCHVI